MTVLSACSDLRSPLAASASEEVYNGIIFLLFPFLPSVSISSLSSLFSLNFTASRRDKFLHHNVFLNTAVIRALQQCNRPEKALEVWNQLNRIEGGLAPVKWDRVAFICILSVCAALGRTALASGEAVHSFISHADLRQDARLFATLLNMYVKCGKPESAIRLAEELWSRGTLQSLAD